MKTLNKENATRILNASEIIIYFALTFFYSPNFWSGCGIIGQNLLSAILFVILLRVCVNYVLKIKLSDIAPVLIVKKILTNAKHSKT